MKKSTWGLLGLLIGQPVLVYLGQSALLPAISSHYGWLGAVAYTSDPHHYFAMLESALIPAVLLAIMPLNKRLSPLLWLTIFRTNFSWWLFGMNWFILISLFVQATWLNWGSMTWILVGLIVFLSKLLGLIATNYRS
ncbi:hypothetical protein ACN677_01830 [Lactiplantibacillus paraplantarum]|uniref:hypothetical protein n=1 Tax=Lactiplantibacillus paraplantarum TaxID=60520 RepID=UPI000512F15E|nr:hypothetical protein [Lactiplantibacillus paraplantarum]ALO04224.1 hypothetical protein ASU28_07580 [Lactiplantibacillus paraplantarum]KGE76126.1 membrane protein [Lactiplantibacillus paraplantarum]